MGNNQLGYLLDTNILLWWLNNDKRLNQSIKELLSNPSEPVVASVVNVWETSIKLKTNPAFKLKKSFNYFIQSISFKTLPVNLDHIKELHRLPYHHRDPFDRILIAQAKVEDLTLITTDKQIRRYSIKTL